MDKHRDTPEQQPDAPIILAAVSSPSPAPAPAPASPVDSSSNPTDSSDEEEFDSQDIVGLREQKGLREVDAESLIAPILSRTQSRALYAAAVAATPTPNHSPPHSVSVSPSSSDDEAAGGVRRIRQPRAPREDEAAGGGGQLIQQRPKHAATEPLQQRNHHHHHKKLPSKDRLNFSLPKGFNLPNVSLPSFGTETMSEKYRRRRAKTLQIPGKLISSTQSTPRSATFFGKQAPREQENNGSIPPPLLRRSSSDTHLRLSRAVTGGSTASASSLGDDTKFLHVHTQTNSRFKAIKDNIFAGLPTMPQLPHFQQHLASLNPFTDGPESPSTLLPRSPALEALDTVQGDVVVMGGYRGSVLRDAATNRRVWIPLKVGFNLRKIDLELGLSPKDEEHATDRIVPDGMLKSISAVDVSRRLIRRLRNNAAQNNRRVHDWGYDWRLSPALIAQKLISFLETLPCNAVIPGEDPTVRRPGRGALVIAHSLGGLITRYAVNQRPELFSGVLFAGTPQTCINILGPLKNGDSVLFNSKVFTAQVNFTLRSSYVFLPEDGHCFIDKKTGEPLPLDFFDPKIWREYGLSPCVSDLPPSQHHLPLGRFSVANLREKEKTAKTDGLNMASTPNLTAPQLNSSAPPDPTPSIPKAAAVPYLERTLAETKAYKQALAFRPELAEKYPPFTVMYSKTTPTVRGAKVDGYEGIKRPDVYEELVFGAGDGVALARNAMLPKGYRCTKKVAVDRGHVSLLGELEGVGECVKAMVAERGW